MANKLSGIIGFGLVTLALVWAPQATDNVALAQTKASAPSQQTIDAVSAGIANLQQQVSLIGQEIESNQISVMPQTMTLDQIQAQVNIIAAKKDQIAVQVAQVVAARAAIQAPSSQTSYDRVSQAIGLIQQATEVIAQEVQASGVPVSPASTVASASENTETQIAVIQEKIAELKEEESELSATPSPSQVHTPATSENQGTASQVSQPASTSTGITCNAATGTCEATSNSKPASSQPATPVQPKSVWQSIWDFIRNLFTF